jgi:ATP-binding cassette subfamily B protein
LASVNVTLGIIVFVWTLIFIGVSYYLSLQIHHISEELTEKSTTFVGKLFDSITNILAVRLFGHRKFEIAFLDTSAEEKVEKEKELGWSNIKLNFIMDIMANILIIYLISFLIFERQYGRVSIGDFTLVFTLALSVIDLVWDVSRHYMRFVEEMGKSTHALKTILIPHAIKDTDNAQPLIIKQGKIEFKNINLALGKKKPLFENFSVTIYAGEKVGIVGPSGSGKTTLLNLIVRLMDVDDGTILIDGQNIKNVTQDSLHQNISFIPQEPMLFHRTILENIRYGRLDASKRDIIQAAKKAFAHDFIQNLPQGYNTLVGERGTTLSGGQRQRLAIARAFLKNSQILILDEATSALDSVTEYYIQKSLESLMEHKTVLSVAHRLSTLMKMDRIIVLDKGVVVEEGRHKSLLRNKGQYYKYWTMQTQKSVI